MSDVPVWLLDIDGVLNATPGRALGSDAWPQTDWIHTHALAETRKWRIMAARPVVEYLRTIHEWRWAEIRWHTTWQDQAPNVGKALGLPEFPVQPAPEFDRIGAHLGRDQWWWKLPAAQRVLAEGRRLIWTDDDTAIELSFAQRATLHGALVIAPNPHTGLVSADLDAIDEFLGWSLPDKAAVPT